MNDVAVQLALVAALVVINAAFAGSEMALVSLRDTQLNRLERRGRRGRTLARLARDPNRFLATIQIGITVAGFLASAFAAVSLAQPLIEPLGFLGTAAEPAAVLLVTLALAFLTLVFGELAPKRVALQRAEGWALAVARPLAALAVLARPAVWVLARATDLAVRLLGGDPALQREEVTDEEVRELVTSRAGFTTHQRSIVDGAFEIAERSVRQIAVPRPRVLALRATTPTAEAARRLKAAGYSRAPVFDGDLDPPLGVVHLRDLVDADGTAADHARDVPVVPETLGVLEALRRLQATRQHLALVIDEYGAVAGIVTLEDILEELVGEIYDEFDRDIAEVRRHDDGTLELPGSFPLHDLPDLDVNLPTSDSDYDTVAGLLLDQLGRLPHPGEAIDLGGHRLTALDVTDTAVTRVRIAPRATTAPPSPAPD